MASEFGSCEKSDGSNKTGVSREEYTNAKFFYISKNPNESNEHFPKATSREWSDECHAAKTRAVNTLLAKRQVPTAAVGDESADLRNENAEQSSQGGNSHYEPAELVNISSNWVAYHFQFGVHTRDYMEVYEINNIGQYKLYSLH
jgi:hypothetical protein